MTTSSATTPLKQIICIKWGTKYGADYVNKLYGMVSRNITPPFRFVCFTDNTDGIRPEVECQDLPVIDYPMPVGTTGQWPKSRLWSEKLGNVTGNVLFLDLDVVIVGNIDVFFEYEPNHPVMLTRNMTNPLEKLGQTSLFRFPVGSLAPLQKLFASDPQGIAEKYRYEQRFVTRNAPGGVELFPRKWVRHFRFECKRPFPINYFLPSKLPKDARVIIFAGGALNPPEAIEGRYRTEYPNDAKEHIKLIATSESARKRPFRHLRHFILPTDWVKEHWRE